MTLALLLVGAGPAAWPGEAPRAAASHVLPRMGMFVLWAQLPDGTDLGGREANLRDWEARLRLPTASLLALDFYGKDTWADMRNLAWLPAYWAKRNPNRKLIWSIPLTMRGTPLADVAAGLHDGEFQTAAESIAGSQPDAVIRIGWEMNGDWFAWAAAGVEADYIAAYRHVAAIFRAASPQFSLDWCTNWGRGNVDPDLAYPGDDLVDSIGMDVYDMPTDQDPATRWTAGVLDVPFGLTWLVEFAARHSKKMSIGEWGVGLRQASDNPLFIEKMHEWLLRNSQSVAYHVYFDAPPSRLESGDFPLSQRRFLDLFTRPR
jgi:hypothetical protein